MNLVPTVLHTYWRPCVCRLWTTEEGRFGVQKVPCARTYHINVLLSIKSLAHGADDRAMVLQRCALPWCHSYCILPC